MLLEGWSTMAANLHYFSAIPSLLHLADQDLSIELVPAVGLIACRFDMLHK